MQDVTEAKESQRFAQMLGFIASLLSGHMTGGTHVGRPLKPSERTIIEEKIADLQKFSLSLAEDPHPLVLSGKALKEAVWVMLAYGDPEKRTKKDVSYIPQLMEEAGVQAMKVVKNCDTKFDKLEEPVHQYLWACKIIAITSFYLARKDRLGLDFPLSAEAKQSLKLKNSKTAERLELEKEFNDIRDEKIVDKMVGSSVVLEALEIMRCIDKKKLNRQTSAMNNGGGIFGVKTRKHTDQPGSKLLRGGRGSKIQNDAFSTLELEVPTKATGFQKFTRNFRKKSAGLLKGSERLARILASDLFMISRILNKFTASDCSVSPYNYTVLPITVPQVFKEKFASVSKPTEKLKAFATNSKYSCVVYDSSRIEVFLNEKCVSKYIKDLVWTIEDPVIYLYEDLLCLGDKSGTLTIHKIEDFQYITHIKTNDNRGGITCICRALTNVALVGFDSGKVGVWDLSVQGKGEFKSMEIIVDPESKLTNEESSELVEFKPRVQFIQYDPSTDTGVLGFEQGELLFFPVMSGPEFQTKTQADIIDSLHGSLTAMHVASGELYTGGTDGNLRIWDIERQEEVYCIKNAHHATEMALLSSVKSARRAPFSVFTRKKPNNGNGRETNIKSNYSAAGKEIKSGSQVKVGWAITGIAIMDTTVITTGLDGKMKIWDLSLLQIKPKPAEVVLDSPPVAVKTDIQGNIYVLGKNLCRYDSEALLHEEETPLFGAGNFNESFNNATFNGLRDSLEDSKPTLVKKFDDAQQSSTHMDMNSDRQGHISTQFGTVRAKTFDEILKGRRTKKAFMAFLRKNFAQENLEYYLSCTRYKKVFSNLPKSAQKREGKSIINRFVERNAPRQINISDAQRKALLELNEFSESDFDTSMKEVYELMRSNFYQDFLKIQDRGSIRNLSFLRSYKL